MFSKRQRAESSQEYILWFNELDLWVQNFKLFVKLADLLDNLNSIFDRHLEI
jgi:hypothetical protein